MDKRMCNWVWESWEAEKWEDWSLGIQGWLQKLLRSYFCSTDWGNDVFAHSTITTYLFCLFQNYHTLFNSFHCYSLSHQKYLKEQKGQWRVIKLLQRKRSVLTVILWLSQRWKASQLPLWLEEYGGVLKKCSDNFLACQHLHFIPHHIRCSSNWLL